MIVLAFPADTAERIVNGEQTVVTYPAAHSEWVVRLVCCGRHDGCYRAASWDDADTFRRSYIEAEGHDRQGIIESLVGQPVAVARLPERNDFFALVTKAGLCRHCGKGPDPDGDHSCPCPHPDDTCPDHPPPVRGAIVGSATVAAVVLIVETTDEPSEGMATVNFGTGVVTRRLPTDWADFTPGRWAVILTDAATCERCPCGDADCDHPWTGIPYPSSAPISEWTP